MPENSANYAESHADPEVYPRPDGTVYICGEAETVDVPENPADIEPRKAAVKALQVRHPLVLPLAHVPHMARIQVYTSRTSCPKNGAHCLSNVGGGRCNIKLASSRHSTQRTSLLSTPFSGRHSCHRTCSRNCKDPIYCQWYAVPPHIAENPLSYLCGPSYASRAPCLLKHTLWPATHEEDSCKRWPASIEINGTRKSDSV